MFDDNEHLEIVQQWNAEGHTWPDIVKMLEDRLRAIGSICIDPHYSPELAVLAIRRAVGQWLADEDVTDRLL